MSLFLRVLLILAAALLLLGCFLAVLLVQRFIRRPKGAPDSLMDTSGFSTYREEIAAGEAFAQSQPWEPVSIRSYDGLKLCARLYERENARGTILLMHGYRGTGVQNFSVILPYYYALGFRLLLTDQRASGESEGDYTCFGVCERFDCRDWACFLQERYADEPVILHGVSMGASTVLMAAGLALPESVRAIVADCGFTSPRAIFSHVLQNMFHLPAALLLLASPLIRLLAGFDIDGCSTLDALKENRLPVLFIHGREDDFVPCYMTEQNHAACTAGKEMHLIDGAGHGMSYLLERERLNRAVAGFLDRVLAQP